MKGFKQFIAKRATSKEPIITEAYPLATNDSSGKIDINQQPVNDPSRKAAEALGNDPEDKRKGGIKPQLGAGLIDHLKIALESGAIEMVEYEGKVKTALNKLVKAIKPEVWAELYKELTPEQKEAIENTMNKEKPKGKINKEQYRKGSDIPIRSEEEPYQNLYVNKVQYRKAR